MGEAWGPVLDGTTRERALDAALVISHALVAAVPRADSADTQPTLAGTLGATLFYAALGQTLADRAFLDVADAGLDAAFDVVAEIDQPTMSLYGAPVALGWAVSVLRPGEVEENDVDTFVANVVGTDGWPWPVDLLHGLAGLGTYCLERLPLPSASGSLARIVGHLANLVEEDADGIAWRYVPLPDGAFRFNEHRPEGNVNLGMAHGVAGIVAFLASASAAGVPGARDLLVPAVRWLLAQRLPPGERSAFPGYVVRGQPAKGTRMAWCYGDPGVAVALLAAGEALDDDGLRAQARAIALGCVRQSPDDVDAAMLCHGSAGLGHLFGRLGHGLRDEYLLDLARHWFGVTLDRHVGGLAVDRTAAKELLAAGGTLAVEPGPGLLSGASGVGLALLSAVSDVPPWWDGPLFARRAAEA